MIVFNQILPVGVKSEINLKFWFPRTQVWFEFLAEIPVGHGHMMSGLPENVVV